MTRDATAHGANATAGPPTNEPPLRVAVLGPLRAWRHGEPLDLGSLQQRTVLAVLALHVGKPRGREQLKAAIWGDDAPAYATNLLQKHVSGLRRLIDPPATRGRASLLTWSEAGYVLGIPPDSVDVAVFERDVRAARALRAANDLPGAARLLHAALDLWRGSLCEGLSCPLLDTERDRLEEHRIGAVEERVDVDLLLGRHALLVPELRQLVADHPLRERLRGALMLALYRSGRAGEALTAFRDAREHLADELGIDPSPALQRLHEQILAADPALDLPAPAVTLSRPAIQPSPDGEPPTSAPAPPPAAQPAQLPHRVPDFTGRLPELARLDEVLAESTAGDPRMLIAVVSGGAGVGKTALALEWAHRVAARFPDGQLFVNLRGFDPSGRAMEPGEAIRGFLDSLGVPTARLPATLEGQAALFRSLVAGRRMLVLLDNARDLEQVRPLLPGSPGCLVLVTSRTALTGLVSAHGAVPVNLELLTEADARELLVRRLTRSRVASEPAAVESIIASCARLPLALAIVAARAATRPEFPLAALAAELAEARGGLDAFDGGDASTDVRAVFSWSYEQLSPRAQRLFRLLGLHPGPEISTAAAAVLGDDTVPRTRSVLTELARAHMVKEVRPGRVALHDLVRAYATELGAEVDDRQERRDALHRLLDFYVQTAQRLDSAMAPNRHPLLTMAPAAPSTALPAVDPSSAVAWFADEHAVLLAVLAAAVADRLDAHAFHLAWSMATYLERGGHWHDLVASQLDALHAANRLTDQLREAYAHRNLACGYTRCGMFDAAGRHFSTALQMFDALDDVPGAAYTHRSYAWALERQAQFEAALTETKRALELFRAVGPPSGLAETLNAVGWFEAQLGRPEQALPPCTEALQIAQRIGHREGEAHTWDSLGLVHHLLGEPDEAIDCFRRAGALWTEIADRYHAAATLVRLGDTYLAAGRSDDAAEVWGRALAILEQLEHPDADGVRVRLADLSPTRRAPRPRASGAADERGRREAAATAELRS